MTTGSTLKTDAEILRRCLELGIVDVPHVFAWADQYIADTVAPNVAVTDVALAAGRSVAVVAGLLRAIPGSTDREGYVRGIFGRMRVLLSKDPSALHLVAKGLEIMVVSDEFLSQSEELSMLSFDDDVELARRGVFGDLGDLREEVLAFLTVASGPA